jgi:hypothetical protein
VRTFAAPRLDIPGRAAQRNELRTHGTWPARMADAGLPRRLSVVRLTAETRSPGATSCTRLSTASWMPAASLPRLPGRSIE